MIANSNTFMQYKRQAINTMSGGELVIKLFEEAYKNVLQADMLFNQENSTSALIYTEKAKRIFTHLISILDMSVDISQNLYQLYNFFNQELIRSEVKRSNEPLKELLPLIKELKETWVQAEKSVHMNK